MYYFKLLELSFSNEYSFRMVGDHFGHIALAVALSSHIISI